MGGMGGIDGLFNTSSFCVAEDLYAETIISFKDSFHGCTVPVDIEREVNRNGKIMKEREKVYLTLPPGVDNNEVITVKNKGHVLNNQMGDVKVTVCADSTDTLHNYERNALNLIYHKEITFKESVCGFDFSIEHINGQNMKFDSSRGNIIQNNDSKVIQGKGFERNGMIGDLIIRFHVKSPESKLTEDQLKLFEDVL